jgi:hypothetical protein
MVLAIWCSNCFIFSNKHAVTWRFIRTLLLIHCIISKRGLIELTGTLRLCVFKFYAVASILLSRLRGTTHMLRGERVRGEDRWNCQEVHVLSRYRLTSLIFDGNDEWCNTRNRSHVALYIKYSGIFFPVNFMCWRQIVPSGQSTANKRHGSVITGNIFSFNWHFWSGDANCVSRYTLTIQATFILQGYTVWQWGVSQPDLFSSIIFLQIK